MTHGVGISEKRAAYRQALNEALDLFTDLDLIVIMRSDLGFIERSAELRKRLEASVDMDLLVYTPEEYERMAEGGFLAHVLGHSVERARQLLRRRPLSQQPPRQHPGESVFLGDRQRPPTTGLVTAHDLLVRRVGSFGSP